MKLRHCAHLLLLMALTYPLMAQDSVPTQDLLNQILHLEIDARLISAEGALLWDMNNNAYTISGRTVDVRLEGSNILAISRLTPYTKQENEVLLVAQGEVWYTRNEEEGMKYYSGMTSIPVSLGESAIFFPLGVEPEKTTEGFIIEIEITVDRYTHQQE